MTKRKENPQKRGRKTLYKAEYAELAFKYSLLGITDAQMADLFGVNEDTLHEWKKRHPKFSESIHNGKDKADAEISHSLYKRAMGFENQEAEVKVVSMGQGLGSEVQVIPVTKYYAPDTRAIQYWMNNRRRRRAPAESDEEKSVWADRQEVDVKSGGKKIAAPFVYLPQDLPRDIVAQQATPEPDIT